MGDRTHVPDKLEGYLLQVRHALFELISFDDRVVSIEAIDDVAIETESEIIAEQTKSVLSSNNPSSNKAVVFWKTIYNWCKYIKDGMIDPKRMTLKYLIVSSHYLSIGSIAQSFAAARTEDEAERALEDARNELFDGESVEPNVSDECKLYVKYCFAAENKDIFTKIIMSLVIEIHEDSYDAELENKFAKQAIPPEYKDELFFAMLGWVQERIHQFTKENKPAYISSEEYRKELYKEIRGRDIRSILSAVSTEPNDAETGIEVKRHDTYIKQLEFISLDTTGIFEAASDYLRTKSEITLWSEKGLVSNHSFKAYDDKLKRIWDLEKRSNERIEYDDDIQKGQALYIKCQKEALNQKLQDSEVPCFFGSGRLHSLANEPSNKPEIGWHSNYVKLLEEQDKDG
ncbi:MAG: hypothetical protein K2G44_00320 [Clostridia bacterium]|nr:hypothetical protein [Clostridia bacterium]